MTKLSRNKKLLKLLLKRSIKGQFTSSKMMNDLVGWDFRKVLSNLRKMGFCTESYFVINDGVRMYYHRIFDKEEFVSHYIISYGRSKSTRRIDVEKIMKESYNYYDDYNANTLRSEYNLFFKL